MPRQVAIGIGVSRVRTLPLLRGVDSGVEEFLRWAGVQGFEVHSFVDSAGTEVSVDPVKVHVRRLVQARDVDKLFVYFAGHGVSTGTGEDVWLLSDARDDPEAVISVTHSVRLARSCGIPHVAFFSDACRTPPTAHQLEIRGRSIFPNLPARNSVRAEVDLFFAAQSGDSAFERVSEDVVVNAFGIFSQSLMDALEGQVHTVLRRIPDGKERYAVEARPLADHLMRQVRLASYRHLAVDQMPDCRAESAWSPNVLSWLQGPVDPGRRQPPSGGGPGPRGSGPTPPHSGQPHDEADDEALLAWLDEERERRIDEEVDAAAHLVDWSDTRPGLAVGGGRVNQALITGGRADITAETGGWHVDGGESEPATALVEVQGGEGPPTWLATGLFPDFAGTAVLGARGVEQLVYVPVGDGGDSAAAIRRFTSTALVRYRMGLFDPDTDEVWSAVMERFDPVITVLAALEHDRRGDQELVLGILRHYESRTRVVPYDVALIAGQDPDELVVPVAPNFPMTTRGWWLADTARVGEEAFTAARPYLAPSLWTAFRNAPTAVMRALVGQVEVEAEVGRTVHA